MTREELDGKRIMLLLWSTDEKGQDDWAVIPGTVAWVDDQWRFESGPDVEFPLPEDALERVRPATPELQRTQGVDVILPLRVESLPDGMSVEGIIPTGLKWPGKAEEGTDGQG